MPLLRHAAPIVALVLLVSACSTPAALPSGPPPASSAPASPGATAAATGSAPTTAASSLEGLSGTWKFVASDPRIIVATGDFAGGSVVINGDRVLFTADDYQSEGPIRFSGTRILDCNATRCEIEGEGPLGLMLVDGRPAIVDLAMLTPLGTFGDGCAAWEDIVDRGVLSVVSTGTVAGQEVPTAVRFSDGAASGVGTACEGGSHVVAWDVTATREP